MTERKKARKERKIERMKGKKERRKERKKEGKTERRKEGKNKSKGMKIQGEKKIKKTGKTHKKRKRKWKKGKKPGQAKKHKKKGRKSREERNWIMKAKDMIQGEQSLLLEVSLPHPYELFFFEMGWNDLKFLLILNHFISIKLMIHRTKCWIFHVWHRRVGFIKNIANIGWRSMKIH